MQLSIIKLPTPVRTYPERDSKYREVAGPQGECSPGQCRRNPNKHEEDSIEMKKESIQFFLEYKYLIKNHLQVPEYWGCCPQA